MGDLSQKVRLRRIVGAAGKQLSRVILNLLHFHILAGVGGRLQIEWRVASYQRLQEGLEQEQERA